VRQHVDGAEDGEFRDILASGVCDGALWVRVVDDRQERRSVAQLLVVGLGEAGVEFAELDPRLVGGDHARGVEGDYELRFTLVGAEKGIQSFALQKEEHALVEHREPLIDGHAVQRLGEGCGVERAVIPDGGRTELGMLHHHRLRAPLLEQAETESQPAGSHFQIDSSSSPFIDGCSQRACRSSWESSPARRCPHS
jgi:hypothetical protein